MELYKLRSIRGWDPEVAHAAHAAAAKKESDSAGIRAGVESVESLAETMVTVTDDAGKPVRMNVLGYAHHLDLLAKADREVVANNGGFLAVRAFQESQVEVQA